MLSMMLMMIMMAAPTVAMVSRPLPGRSARTLRAGGQRASIQQVIQRDRGRRYDNYDDRDDDADDRLVSQPKIITVNLSGHVIVRQLSATHRGVHRLPGGQQWAPSLM